MADKLGSNLVGLMAAQWDVSTVARLETHLGDRTAGQMVCSTAGRKEHQWVERLVVQMALMLVVLWVVAMAWMSVVLLEHKMGAHWDYLRDDWLADTTVQPLGRLLVVVTE